MTQFSDERGAELRDLFFESAQEILQTLNDEALKLEKHPGDAETVRTIRRSVHTLKGDAAACGFRELSELAHELEDALSAEATSSHSSLAEVAFTAADVFNAMLASYRGQGKLPSAEPLRNQIRELVGGGETRESHQKKTPPAAADPPAWTEYENLAVQNALRQGKRVYQIRAQLDPLCAMPIAARQLLLNALATVGEVLGALPESHLPQATKRVHLLLASAQPAEKIVAKCRIPTVIAHVSVDEVRNSASGKSAPAEAAPPEPGSRPAASSAIQAEPGLSIVDLPAEETESRGAVPVAVAENILRVDAERIDSLLNLVGELIIGKSMLQQALNDFARRYPKEATRGRLADALAFQARVLNDLQRSVMKVRMVPVEQLFRRFPRMVRDVAKQCGKEVELVISGQHTDLDKSLLDAIAEPITHLVRNGISHGIEAAEERARRGKPALGTIRLDAYHYGNQVIVEVSDDGNGIDSGRVIAKAIEKKLISPEQASGLSESDILQLVFQPGFSTAQEITEISGRGVGLDVVQSVLHRLKGTVEVFTHPGQGTTFCLKLPLTLAIIKALLFRVERRLYAIPLNAVAEISRATEADVHQVDNYEVVQLRGQVLPLVRLGRPHNDLSKNSLTKIFVLVVTLGERKLGLIVDGLEGEEELVIKAVDDQTVATDLVSGASILGDGRVVLILNLAAVVERSTKAPSNGTSGGLLLLRAEREPAALAAPGGAR
jgi:two-component system chemotaxis sensor kinase CheA